MDRLSVLVPDSRGNKADIWYLRQHPKVLNLPWVEKIRRADRDNTIDIYISEDHDDVLADGVWQQFFTEKPEVLTREEKRAWLDTLKGSQEWRGIYCSGRRFCA